MLLFSIYGEKHYLINYRKEGAIILRQRQVLIDCPSCKKRLSVRISKIGGHNACCSICNNKFSFVVNESLNKFGYKSYSVDEVEIGWKDSYML